MSMRATHIVCKAEMHSGAVEHFTVTLESTEATMVDVYRELTALLDEEVASVYINGEATIITPSEIEDLYPIKLLRPYSATTFANADAQTSAISHLQKAA